MIHEQHEGEPYGNPAMEAVPEGAMTVEHIENDINLIQQQEPIGSSKSQQRMNQIEYENDEDEVVCGRFPHLDVCACDISCQIALKEINIFEVYPGIYMGPYQSAFKTQELIEKGITHILNVSCKEYTKRQKYFKYLDVFVQDEVGENAQKYFRITNRFVDEGRKQGGILVHSVQGKSRAPAFILAYMIYFDKIKLKDGLAMLREFVNEVEPNESFM